MPPFEAMCDLTDYIQTYLKNEGGSQDPGAPHYSRSDLSSPKVTDWNYIPMKEKNHSSMVVLQSLSFQLTQNIVVKGCWEIQ